jgi:hypothetical protein
VRWDGQARKKAGLEAAHECEHGQEQEKAKKDRGQEKYTREFVAAQYRLAAERRRKQNEEPLSHGAFYADSAEALGSLMYPHTNCLLPRQSSSGGGRLPYLEWGETTQEISSAHHWYSSPKEVTLGLLKRILTYTDVY